MKTRLVGLLLVAGWLFSGLSAAAEQDSPQAKDEWRGQKVLATKPGVLLREQPNDQAPTSPVSTAGIWLEVKRREGDWLEVDWGWIRAAHAVREDLAVEHFTAELAKSENAFAYIHRSRAWLKKSEFDKAQADVSEALRLEPNNARAYFVRSRIAADQNRTGEGLSACDRALAIDPRDPIALASRSELKATAGAVDGAIGDLDRAIESLSRCSLLWTMRGHYRESKGDYDNALADFNEAIQLDPHATYPLSRRATIYLRRQELGKALRDAEDAVRADPKLANGYAIRGAIRAQKSEWDAALVDLDEAIRLNATDPVTFHNRGTVYYRKGQYDAAVLDFTQAIALNPNAVENYTARADALEEQGDAASAINDLTLYLQLRPNDANALSQRGWLKKGTDVDAAFKDWNAALAINPRHVGALLGRSQAWQRKNEPAKALDDANAALDLAPNNLDALLVRGWLRMDADLDAALKDFDAALAINPRRLDALLWRGEIWRRKADPEKAIADLTSAIEVDPKYADAYWRRAQVYSSQGKHRRAIDDFTAVLRIKPGDIDCLMRRSGEWSSAGNVEQAVADCRAVLANDPKKTMAYVLMAQAHFEAGQNEEALEDFAEAMRVDPHDEDIRFQRAYHLFLQDKFEQALADLDEVIQNGKRVGDAYNWRGYLRMRRRRFEEAIADFNEAVRLEPEDADNYRMRADCWYAMKQFDKAIADAVEALRLNPKSEAAALVRRQALEAKQDPSKADGFEVETHPSGREAGVIELTGAERARIYECELKGPAGLRIAFLESEADGDFGPERRQLPIHLPILDEMPMLLKLTRIAGNSDAAVYVLLKGKQLSQRDLTRLHAANPSITLAQADLDAALAGKEVTKILVLRRKAGEVTGKVAAEQADESEFEVVNSGDLDAKTDPAEAASARGAILATLKLKNAPFETDASELYEQIGGEADIADEDRINAVRAAMEQISSGAVAAGPTDKQLAPQYEVELKGPEGLKLLFASGGPDEFGPASAPFPLRAPMFGGGLMSFKFAGLPGEKDLYLLIGSKRLSPQDLASVRGMKPAITLAQTDLDAALAGKDVTKILVLRRKAGKESAEETGEPELEVVSGAQLDAEADTIESASARGAIVAIFKLAKQSFGWGDLKSVMLENVDYGDIAFDSVVEPVRLYEIELQGPEGVKVAYQTVGAEKFAADFMHLPIHQTMSRNTVTRFKLAGIPGNADAPLYLLLTPKTPSTEVLGMVRAANPVLSLSEAELSAALAGADVTKILVLRHRKGEPSERPEFELLSSTDLDPETNPVAAASRRGAVIAGLLISKRVPAIFSLELDDEQLALCLKGPEGLTVTYEGPAPYEFNEATHSLPARFYQGPDMLRRFKLGGPPVATKDSVYASLETAPTLPSDNPLLTERQLPITLSKTDLDAALAGKKVTRVVYLAKPEKEGDSPQLESLSSIDMEPGQDPLAEAAKRGAVIATVRLSRQADLPFLIEPPAAGAKAEEEGQPDEPQASQIIFSGLKGMTVQWDVTGPRKFDSEPLVVPGRFNFPKGAIYALKLSRIPGHQGIEIYATLEAAPPLPRTDAYLEHNAIPIEFTAEDIDHVLEGKPLTKVVFLPDPVEESALQGGPATLVSSRLRSGLNAILEADRLGAILAIIRVGTESTSVVEKPNASVAAEAGGNER